VQTIRSIALTISSLESAGPSSQQWVRFPARYVFDCVRRQPGACEEGRERASKRSEEIGSAFRADTERRLVAVSAAAVVAWHWRQFPVQARQAGKQSVRLAAVHLWSRHRRTGAWRELF